MVKNYFCKVLLSLVILLSSLSVFDLRSKKTIFNLASAPEFRWACESGDVAKVREMIKKGGDVNASDEEGRTSLFIATIAGKVEIARTLIKNGANIDAEESLNRCTPLSFAAEEGDAKMCELLIENGATLIVCCEAGCGNGRHPADRNLSPFDKASESGHPDLFPILFKAIRDLKNDGQISWLMETSARNGNKDVLDYFISQGIDVDYKIRSDQTPLFCAVYGNYNSGNEAKRLATVSFLLSKGANINAKASYEGTPLHVATMVGSKKMCELLISKGANINAKSDSGATPLMFAINYVEDDYWPEAVTPIAIEIVEYLISQGADVNAKTVDGYTALHLAASTGIKELCEYLVLKGADPKVRTKNGQTPSMIVGNTGRMNEDLKLWLRSKEN